MPTENGEVNVSGAYQKKYQRRHQRAEKKPVKQATVAATRRLSKARKTETPVLTLESLGEVETEDVWEEVIWHEIHNVYRIRKILIEWLGGIEQTDSGKTIVVVDYKGFRIVIHLKEMMINLVQGRSPSGKEYAELMLCQNKVLGNMLGRRSTSL